MTKKVLLPLLGAVILSGCIHERFFPSKSQPESETPVMEQPVLEGTETPTVDTQMVVETTGEIMEFTVEGSEFMFTPKVLNVKQGDTVSIVFKNTGKMPHDFRIDELGVATEILQSGETQTIEFVAAMAGEFEFYCSVNNHRAQGMVGTLSVR